MTDLEKIDAALLSIGEARRQLAMIVRPPAPPPTHTMRERLLTYTMQDLSSAENRLLILKQDAESKQTKTG